MTTHKIIFNLLPWREQLRKNHSQRIKRVLITALLIGTASLAATHRFLNNQVRHYQKQLIALTEQIKNDEPKTRILPLNVIEKIIRNQQTLKYFMKGLWSLAQTDFCIRKLHYQPNRIKWQIEADSHAKIVDYFRQINIYLPAFQNDLIALQINKRKLLVSMQSRKAP